MTNDCHMDDLIASNVPKTISVDFLLAVSPKGTSKIVFLHVPFGETESKKSSEIVLGRSAGIRPFM